MASSMLRKERTKATETVTSASGSALREHASLDDETRAAATLSGSAETSAVEHLRAPAVRLKTLLRVAVRESALRKGMAEEIAMNIATRVPGAIHNFLIRLDEKNHYVLEGWCTSYHAKQVAQHEAMLLAGNSQVVNEIVVRRQR